jgi:Leucine-rich repeat (LRR) protein
MSAARNPKFSTLFFALLLLLPWQVLAQSNKRANPSRIPVYRSKADSAKITELEQALRALSQSTTPQIKASDSLMTLYRKLSSVAIIGVRKVYSPDSEYLTLDSVLRINDPLTVKKISLYDYPSKDLPPVIFQCRNLVSLELIKTNIRKLPEGLNALTQLRQIKIYNPRRGRVKLKKNNTVTELIFSGATPRSLPRSYRLFSALEKLDLSGNWLKRFPQGARRNKNLRELNLQDNQLNLRQKLKAHPHIETLALQHNQIAKVPASIRSFIHLKKLNFNYNQITSVHPNIRFLTQLEHLSFYNNELQDIPEGLYDLKALREIDLFHNRIETVDERVSRWENLKMLYLSHNEILSLPETIGNMPSLEGLYVWDNRISTLPESLGKIQTLRFLWVNNNNLVSLPASLLNLAEIEELDLSHNFLTKLPDAVFDFEHLKILSLPGNPWDKNTIEIIFTRAPLLRSRNVFVHLPDE